MGLCLGSGKCSRPIFQRPDPSIWLNRATSEDLAYLRHGNASFLLQNFYNKDHADNFMMHSLVENVEAWWRHVLRQDLVAKYGVHAEPPADRSWGIRDFVIMDPTGVTWRVGQNIAAGG